MGQGDDKGYRTAAISSRRYLGNKYKLLPFITGVVARECPHIESIADIFAGTGAVSSAFPDKILLTNDLMYSNYICNFAWFGAQRYDAAKIIRLIRRYNGLADCGDNYMTENFADTYFSRADCAKIGFIRQDIEERYQRRGINRRERALLITSLLYAMDKIAKTCGHYDAYRKGAVFDAALSLCVPEAAVENNPGNRCYNRDANQLVKAIRADLVYIDPPYNSRQYCDAYHMLENVARWQQPPVFGVARKMNRSQLKSKYCTQSATEAFAALVRDIRADYILLSYNNMAEKGNGRSNAKLADSDILRVLRQKGAVQIFSERYKPFSAGKSAISGHEERLFLCACGQKE